MIVKLIVSTLLAAFMVVSAFGVAATTDPAPAVPPPVDSWCALGHLRPGQAFSRTEPGAPKAGSGLQTTMWSRPFYPNFNCVHTIGQRLESGPGLLSSS